MAEKEIKFRPFRAVLPKDPQMLDITAFPFMVSPKIDGIRALTPQPNWGFSATLSKTLKPIPNTYIQQSLAQWHWLDGELVIGDHFGPGVYDRAKSEVMTIRGEPDFYYWVFDTTAWPEMPAIDRYAKLLQLVGRHPRIKVVPQFVVNNYAEMIDACEALLEAGFEGGMVKNVKAPYKLGQSTIKEQHLFKFKPYADADAEIIGFVEKLQNLNEATINDAGYQVRSSHADGKVPAGTLGAFECRSAEFTDTFTVGAGPLGAMAAQEVWNNRQNYVGRAFKFKYQQHGCGKDAPRQPVFLTWRPEGA